MTPRTATRAETHVPGAEIDDPDLVARLRRGEAGAFDEVVERYVARVTALAARLLGWSAGADDVAQEVFLTLLRKGSQFGGRSSLWTYLAAITVNRCRSVRRRRWLHDRVLRVIAPGCATSPPAEQWSEQQEQAARIRAAVAALPATSREVIVLRYFEDLPIQDIAQALGVARNTVEVRLFRARKLLQAALPDLADEDSDA